jgi:hypothetical protein
MLKNDTIAIGDCLSKSINGISEVVDITSLKKMNNFEKDKLIMKKLGTSLNGDVPSFFDFKILTFR